MGRRDEARAAIVRARPGLDPDLRLAAIEESLRDETGGASWREVFAPAWRRPLAVGIGLAVYQQVTGINAIIYYSDRIFAAAGFATPAAQAHATTWAVGAVNVRGHAHRHRVHRPPRAPAAAAGRPGRHGREPGGGGRWPLRRSRAARRARARTTAGIVTLVALVVFIASFAFSLGPVVWTVINEIFPGRVRGRAVAVATAVNWGAAFVVSQYFLSLVDAIGESLTFGLFALFCAVGFAWVIATCPRPRAARSSRSRRCGPRLRRRRWRRCPHRRPASRQVAARRQVDRAQSSVAGTDCGSFLSPPQRGGSGSAGRPRAGVLHDRHHRGGAAPLRRPREPAPPWACPPAATGNGPASARTT